MTYKNPTKDTCWIDISMSVHSGMVHWPGDPEIEVKRVSDISKGGVCNVSQIHMGTHTGTHMDAPLHFVADGRSIDEMPVDAAMGKARVISIENTVSVTADELRRHEPKPGERLLFRTRNSEFADTTHFHKDFVYVAPDAAQLLADTGVGLVGVDYMSVGAFDGDLGAETHRILLTAGIWVIENLQLRDITPGEYELLCLPLRVEGGDGAPCRALLRKGV